MSVIKLPPSVDRFFVWTVLGVIAIAIHRLIYYVLYFPGSWLSEDGACRALTSAAISTDWVSNFHFLSGAWLTGHFFTIAFVMNFISDPLLASMSINFLSGMLLVWGYWKYSIEISDSKTALVVLWLTAISFLPNFITTTALVEPYFLCCLIWGVNFLFQFQRTRKISHLWLSIGLLSMANFLRYDGWLFTCFFAGYLVYSDRKRIKDHLPLLTLGLIPLLTMSVHYYFHSDFLYGVHVNTIETLGELKYRIGSFSPSLKFYNFTPFGLWWVILFPVGIFIWLKNRGDRSLLLITLSLFFIYQFSQMALGLFPIESRYTLNVFLLILPFAVGGLLKFKKTKLKFVYYSLFSAVVLVGETFHHIYAHRFVHTAINHYRPATELATHNPTPILPSEKVLIQAENFCSVALELGLRHFGQMDHFDAPSKEKLEFYNSNKVLINRLKESQYSHAFIYTHHFSPSYTEWQEILSELPKGLYEKTYDDGRGFILIRQ